jgi:hypothetical protein
MQEASLLPSQPAAMPFSAFLFALFRALEQQAVRFCVLRNYEGFPENNAGSDIDFLIVESDLPRAVRALGAIEGIRVVGFSERSWVAHAFVEGVRPSDETRAMQVDFLWNLSWKGLTYAPGEEILRTAIVRRAGNLEFLVPSAPHEAITSLFASLLKSGWLKEKYFAQVQTTFATSPDEVRAALIPQFGTKTAKTLLSAVIAGDRRALMKCVRPLRTALALRSLLYKPLSSVVAIVRHYVREIAVRFSPASVENVNIVGPDQRIVEEVVHDLLPILYCTAKVVETSAVYLPGPQASARHAGAARASSPAQPGTSPAVSMTAVIRRLGQEWFKQFFGKKELTLRVYAGSIDDLLIDPERFGFRGFRWVARAAGAFSPPSQLWILLDTSLGRLQANVSENQTAEKHDRIEAYNSLVTSKRSYAILNAAGRRSSVVEDAYAAVTAMLAQRTAAMLGRRFQ